VRFPLGHVTRMDEVCILKQALHWEVAGPGRPRMNWRDVVKQDLQRMGLPGKRLKHQLKTDIRGVNVWPYVSVMLDELKIYLDTIEMRFRLFT